MDFMRDPHLAQVHILITLQQTGSGGRQYIMDFIGHGEFEGKDKQLVYVSEQSDTDDIRRQGITLKLKMGLMSYVSETSMASNIEISYNEEKSEDFQERTKEPWNCWRGASYNISKY